MDLSKYSRTYLERMRSDCYLTEDEELVYQMLTRGKSIIQIASALNMSTRTVDRRIRSIKDKLNM